MPNGVLPDPPFVEDDQLYDFLQQIHLFVRDLDIAALEEAAEALNGGGFGGSNQIIVGDQTPGNFSIPPDVENFIAIPGLTNIALVWDLPPAGADVTYTEIRRGTINPPGVPVPNINDATDHIIAEPNGQYVDLVGAGSPEYFYYARFVRDIGGLKIPGAWTTHDVIAQTDPALQQILDLLVGQLEDIHLNNILGDRIDLIDAIGTGLVDRINSEEADRIAEILRVENLSNAGDNALSAQIDTLVLASGGRFIRADDPPDPNTDPLAPFTSADRWIDTNDGNHPHAWDVSIGNTATPPFNWVSVRDAEIQQNTALILSQQQAIVDLENDKAEASDVLTLSTTVGANTTSIQQTIQSLDGVNAQFAVVIDANGAASGFTLIGGGPTSLFNVAADLFVVSRPGFPTDPVFAVGQIGGEDRIVFNASAHMGDASIENAMIGNMNAEKLFVLEGTIAEAVIGSGHIQNAMIGNVIQSDNWNPVTKEGWRLVKSGLFEGRGITIYDNDSNVVFGTGNGFQLNWARVNGANRPEDNATFGAEWGSTLNGVPFLQESMENTTKWVQFSGSGNFDFRSDTAAQFGGRILQANGFVHIDYTEPLPFDENATYRVQVRVAGGAGSRPAFIGVFGLGHDQRLVNRVGADTTADQYYILSNGASVNDEEFVTLEAYIQGYSAGDGTLGDGTLENPATMHPAVRYIRPVMLLNFSAGNTLITKVDRFTLDKTEPQITDANISTYIRSAAVDTLYLAGSAVTVTAVAESGPQNGSGVFSPATSVSITLNVPAPVLVDWSIEQGFPTGPGQWGVRITDTTNNITSVDRIVDAVNDFPSGKAYFFMAAGTHVFTMDWYGASNVVMDKCTLTVLAAKR